MKRLNLSLLMVLFAAIAFAQGPLKVNPQQITKSDILKGKFSSPQMLREGLANATRGIPRSGARMAPRKAPSDYYIISEQPEGELKSYERSGSYLYVSGSSLYVGTQSGYVSIVYDADGETVYIKDPLMGADYGSWVEGTIIGDKLVVSVPQNLLYVADYDACIAMIPIDSYRTADETAEDITYTITDGQLTLDGFTSYNRTLGAYWTDDHTIQVYGEFNTVFTEVDEVPVPVEAPADLATEEWFMFAYDHNDAEYYASLQIGFDGSDVYIQGLCSYLPDAWVKGTLSGSQVVVPTGQYYGSYGGQYDMWFVGYGGSGIEDVVFSYDAVANQLTTDQLVILNGARESLSYYAYYSDVVITKVVEKAATPADPVITSLTNSQYGYYIAFTIPIVDTNGDGLVSSKLSYVIYSDVEGDISPLTFTPATHIYLDEDLTEIPYGFTEDYDFYDGQIYLNELYSEDWNRIGIKSIYTGGGETNETEIQWCVIKPYAVTLEGKSVDNVDFYATYYDSENSYEADANTTVYTAVVNGSELELTEVADGIIPAGNAVVLKSTQAKITLAGSTAAASVLANNDLQGSDEAQTLDADQTYYVLSGTNDVVGFYKFTGAQLGAHKAYITLPADAAVKALTFGEGATGIALVERGVADGVWYSLQGVRVAQPTKGIYLRNGKKVVVK